MSVLKEKRNLSGIEFIEQAKKLVSHTFNYTSKFPKNTMFKFQTRLCDLSTSVLEGACSANSIMGNNSLRKEYLQKALAALNSFETLLSVVQEGHLQYVSDFGWQEWGRLIDYERTLLLGQIKILKDEC